MLPEVMTLAAQDPAVSGWEIAAAIGSILGALATALAVAVALYLGRRDREAADRAVQDQIRANAVAVERQIEANAAEVRSQLTAGAAAARQEHEVEVLLELNKQLAINATTTGGPQEDESLQIGRGLVLALPASALRDMAATRALFARGEVGAFAEGLPSYRDVYRQSTDKTVMVRMRAQREIAAQIRARTSDVEPE